MQSLFLIPLHIGMITSWTLTAPWGSLARALPLLAPDLLPGLSSSVLPPHPIDFESGVVTCLDFLPSFLPMDFNLMTIVDFAPLSLLLQVSGVGRCLLVPCFVSCCACYVFPGAW